MSPPPSTTTNTPAAVPAVDDQKYDVEYLDNADLGKPDPESQPAINQPHGGIYAEALTRYPSDDSIDAVLEKKVRRRLDFHIIPLLGICYFFYYVDKTTLYGLHAPPLPLDPQHLGRWTPGSPTR